MNFQDFFDKATFLACSAFRTEPFGLCLVRSNGPSVGQSMFQMAFFSVKLWPLRHDLEYPLEAFSLKTIPS
jgi:hypothetical protein